MGFWVEGVLGVPQAEGTGPAKAWGQECHCRGPAKRIQEPEIIFFFFLVTALLRYNTQYAIHPFKCTIQWFLLFTELCTITTTNFRTWSSPQE